MAHGAELWATVQRRNGAIQGVQAWMILNFKARNVIRRAHGYRDKEYMIQGKIPTEGSQHLSA